MKRALVPPSWKLWVGLGAIVILLGVIAPASSTPLGPYNEIRNPSFSQYESVAFPGEPAPKPEPKFWETSKSVKIDDNFGRGNPWPAVRCTVPLDTPHTLRQIVDESLYWDEDNHPGEPLENPFWNPAFHAKIIDLQADIMATTTASSGALTSDLGIRFRLCWWNEDKNGRELTPEEKANPDGHSDWVMYTFDASYAKGTWITFNPFNRNETLFAKIQPRWVCVEIEIVNQRTTNDLVYVDNVILTGKCVAPPEHLIGGTKWYDLIQNGKLDPGEFPISGFRIDVYVTLPDGTNTVVTTYTGPDGKWSAGPFPEGTQFKACEVLPLGNWTQTGPAPGSINPGGEATADASMCWVGKVGTQDVPGLDFFNVCQGTPGGHTPGYWSNKNGFNTMNDGGTVEPELAMLRGLCLRNADGSDFDPTTYIQFRTWLLGGNAVNMAYMLSVHLAAMSLNVEAGFVSGDAIVSSPVLGFISIKDLLKAANDALCADGYTPSGDPNRACQEALKNALDAANNNQNFVFIPCPVIYPTTN